MPNLNDLKRELVANGRLSADDIVKLREAMFADGMNREKGDFLFQLKDLATKEHIDEGFKTLFVEALTMYLLDDYDSPGEISERESKWLRAKIQHKGYVDSMDELLLDNLRSKSINFPEILNCKSKAARLFENGLYYSRYLTILAVIGSLVSAIVLFIRGSIVVVNGVMDFATGLSENESEYENLLVAFVSSVDIYLFAMVLIIFGMGIYELFINKIDPVERKADSRPSWLRVSSIDDLKSSLGKVILMVLIVSFFKHSLDIRFASALDLLLLAVGVVLVALALFIAHKHPNKHEKE